MNNLLKHQRILIITRNLPPLVGGMERLNWHMAEELSRCAEVRVIGPEGAAALAPSDVPVREVPLKPLWKFLLHACTLARREAQAWKPDLVLAGSGLVAPLARVAARACGAKTAVYVHGLDVAVKHPIYRAIWIPALRRMDRVIANSHATAGLCRDIGINPAIIGIVHPGVDLPGRSVLLGPPSRAEVGEMVVPVGTNGEESSPPSAGRGPRVARGGTQSVPNESVGFRARHNLANRLLLLSVGRLSARKGLREFVKYALPRIVAVYPEAVLLIVGDVPKDALHAEAQSPDSIRAAAEHADVARNLRFLGTITDYAELGDVYRAADVHVFPVCEIPGDPEGFGMVAVEAAAHGLPTVAFATGGVVDAMAEKRSGYLVIPGDYPSFAGFVLTAFVNRNALRESSIEFAQQFAWPVFGTQLVAQLTYIVPSLEMQGGFV